MTLKLYGRVFITGQIVVKTGLHIGAAESPFEIGGVDKAVISDPLTNRPYIPGSSLRGKMRSLIEKKEGKVTGQVIGDAVIHACQTESDYLNCPICNVFGMAAEKVKLNNNGGIGLSRLIVRDVQLDPDSAKSLEQAKTDLPYTEAKVEVAIDRVTSESNPRTVERVPAGAVFGPAELVYSIYGPQDVDWLTVLVDGMELLQDDYLGGMGSRGSGKVEFANLKVTLKRASDYRKPISLGEFSNLGELSQALSGIIKQIHGTLKQEG